MNTDKNSTQHWNAIYQNKKADELSWYQESPKTSIHLIKQLQLSSSAGIIDIGGGESRLVDALLVMGYTNITVLDISETALQKAQKRLGDKSKLVQWVVSDVTEFKPTKKYDLWHDRAAFHFLTTEHKVKEYISVAEKSIRQNGYLIVGTFSETGPTKCSGLDIKQYSDESLNNVFKKSFQSIGYQYTDHQTPFHTIQHFLFCTFQRSNQEADEKPFSEIPPNQSSTLPIGLSKHCE